MSICMMFTKIDLLTEMYNATSTLAAYHVYWYYIILDTYSRWYSDACTQTRCLSSDLL